ncbi:MULTISPECIES: hypothetical protein [unclassified Variovorax]|jgi:hypothetical protein|uniref:hypothetical protein n=1 Tax=unclassified Variovorax TaxID=663243 RepID=UPI000B00B5D5|nr:MULTISPECIES: hypothetical protein [unclassified Variovorax]
MKSIIVCAAILALGSSAFARGGGGHSSSGHGSHSSSYGSSTGSSSSGSHSTSGYTKSNGTYVAPSHATNPNSTKADNWSTKGNVNPYTGKAGTKSQD